MALRLAYAALSLGLMALGALLAWLALRRPVQPAGVVLRLGVSLAALTALAGAVAAVVLEARVAQPW